MVVLFVSVGSFLWSQREAARESSANVSQTHAPVASGGRLNSANQPAAGGIGRRQLKAPPDSAAQVAISPLALQLGQATQMLNLSYESLAKLTPQDVDYLNQCYQSRTNLPDRAELTNVLGKIGNEQTVALFIHCLTEEHAGRVFNEMDHPFGQGPEMVLFNTAAALGVLSSRFDSAFEFLKQGVRPEFWESTIRWQSEKGPRTAGMMTAFTIDCLGSSGRDEVRVILADLLVHPPSQWPPGDPRGRTFGGAIISGAFWLDYVQEHGVETYKAGHGPEIQSAYQRWRASERAKPWSQAK